MLKHNPVVRNGLFRVTLGDCIKKYRAVDEAEAKHKFLTHLGMVDLPYYPAELNIEVIEPTIRELN